MRRPRIILGATAAALAFLFVGASAWAAHHEAKKDGHGHCGKHRGMHFEKRDTDGNGEISEAEWLAAAGARFEKMDRDGSGAVSQDEWTGAHEAMKKRMKEHREDAH